MVVMQMRAELACHWKVIKKHTTQGSFRFCGKLTVLLTAFVLNSPLCLFFLSFTEMIYWQLCLGRVVIICTPTSQQRQKHGRGPLIMHPNESLLWESNWKTWNISNLCVFFYFHVITGMIWMRILLIKSILRKLHRISDCDYKKEPKK